MTTPLSSELVLTFPTVEERQAAQDLIRRASRTDTRTVPMSELQDVAEEHERLKYQVTDLRERLVKAIEALDALADVERPDMDSNYFRVIGKSQGVKLALSYLDEMTR